MCPTGWSWGCLRGTTARWRRWWRLRGWSWCEPRSGSREKLAAFFGDGLGLGEEGEVVGAAGFAVSAAHVEAAEGMSADHRASALAIEVKIADVELGFGAIELLAGAGVDGAGEAVLGVVGHGEGFVEVRGL